ncbi:protein phosphatase 2C domain-containing protein [Pseudomonas sp. 5P_3.1_Bac2]|uniref:protein phosphatase 2C domain-containing protein n=1 Tax=Pseudomonas sp. 5P_3.1_Bac2 TaxID=2971617 RepID=UPI0021C9B6F1|nr:protein phosphatase 2C domain-containing protein [Pseudomonas sp. 5P_3.1_Bac2]MCU1718178.1 protein phosphatase 2C domain-containing protein [Pseudomonas sp. 5P_3.1_Bac2]
MRVTLNWQTQTGTLTTNNRDASAHIERSDASLYLIADGSSSRQDSGELAIRLLAELAQGFEHLPVSELLPEQLAEALVQVIAITHQQLRDIYPNAACSYLVLCQHADAMFSIHEGDCCLGLRESDNTIRWLNAPHCLANWQGNLSHAELAQMPSRHRLTRCFSPRRANSPEINHWPLSAKQHWLLATDGFWAGLNDQQQQCFLNDGSLTAPPTDDDISCLSIIYSATG